MQKIASGITHLQRGPTWQNKRARMHNAHKERYEGEPVSLPEEDEDEGCQGGSAEPQV